MAIFKRRTMLAQVAHAETIVGLGVTLSGKIEAKNNIQINGTFIGEIVAEGDVIVGEEAEVTAPISAKNATIAGIVNGDVNVVNELDILTKGKVFGNISSKILTIKPGGIFSGKSVMHANIEDQKIVKPTYETE
ncbi:MAG TPA: polymer-forming cytoskeletal protein [Patescibacteria group bacterium]|nr:polymer-forming cytoskeletal protein [Patescibacteria group bacterium]